MLTRRFALGSTFCFLLFLLLAFSGYSCGEEKHGQSEVSEMSSLPAAHTWFIRPDGGDRKQCTGKADAAYRGKGAKQQCSYKHPYYLFTDDGYNSARWVVEGGDMVIIRGGPYQKTVGEAALAIRSVARCRQSLQGQPRHRHDSLARTIGVATKRRNCMAALGWARLLT